jgi:hypothetical protein
MIKIEIKSNAQSKSNETTEMDYKPLIGMFELLLEWDMKDVQEKEEKRKEVSQTFQRKNNQI